MKIYFAGSIRGGREDVLLYQEIIQMLAQYGTVLTEHVADAAVIAKEEGVTDTFIFEQDVAWLKQADVVVAEVTRPSLGVGYEIGIAESLGKTILCLHRTTERMYLSAMIAGNKALHVKRYGTVADLREILEVFMREHMRVTV